MAALGLTTALGFLDGRAFPGEFLALFRLQYLAAAVVLAGLAAAGRRRRSALAAAVAAAVNLLGLLPAALAPGRPDPERPRLRLVVLNVWWPGDHHARVAALVEREQPDVVALTELTPAWAEAIAPALRDYPHRLLRPADGSFGVGLFSRLPLRDPRILEPEDDDLPPVARAGLDRDGSRVELFVVHAPGVLPRAAAGEQREFVGVLAELVRAAGARALVCGDLNAAPWSRPFRELLDAAGLERDDPWRPFEGTFPVWSRLLRTPIDQCAAGGAVSVASRAGPDVGSDHLPLLVEVG